ncbi:MAG: MoxR family ATPase [Planctomycetota bacterium]
MSDPQTPDEVKAAAEQFRTDFAAVREQIGRAVVGHSDIIDGVLLCLFTGGHALLEGVPGLGKTLLIRSLSQALHLEFNRIQFTPDLMPADITGTSIVDDTGQGKRFVFQPGPVFTQILLADEINRATPKTQAALLEAMQEKRVTSAGETRDLPRPFFVMATQNPIEQEGTYPLPEAQLDRFFFKLNLGYSTRDEMQEILKRTTSGTSPEIESVLDAEGIVRHQRLVARVAIAEHVQDFAVRCVLATHPQGEFATPMVNRFVRVGASPRAAQALVLGAKCLALVRGRAAASIDDIKAIALPALRHRVLLNFEGEAEGLDTDQVVSNIIETIPTQLAAASA